MRQAFSAVNAQPLADSAAERDSAERKLLDPQRVSQPHNIAAQPLHRIFTRRGVGSAMASRVVSQNLKMPRHIRGLRSPHAAVGSDGMRKYQDRTPYRAFEAIKQPRAVDIRKRQDLFLLFRILPRRLR